MTCDLILSERDNLRLIAGFPYLEGLQSSVHADCRVGVGAIMPLEHRIKSLGLRAHDHVLRRRQVQDVRVVERYHYHGEHAARLREGVGGQVSPDQLPDLAVHQHFHGFPVLFVGVHGRFNGFQLRQEGVERGYKLHGIFIISMKKKK